MNQQNYYDVVIVGGGISGINVAYYLQKNCPKKSYIMLESRSSLGGTWDLFKYPGIRSDSDMFTLGFRFNPWTSNKGIAEGKDILDYLKQTAQKYSIDKNIRYNNKLIEASWSDEEKKWTLTIEHQHERIFMKCSFLMMSSGYYNYEKGYLPDFKNMDLFQGKIIHPQNWNKEVDYSNKNIVVIGSGATAITLVPKLAKKAQKVVMLQRTPTYILPLINHDPFVIFLQKYLPQSVAYSIIRWRNVLVQIYLYQMSKFFPKQAAKIIKRIIKSIIKEKYNEKDFSPPYNPWDQRLCLDVNAEFLKEIKKGNVEIVTDSINQFTQNGILLNSGKELITDMVVTATGLNLHFLGGVKFYKNGVPLGSNSFFAYRGVFCSNLPNIGFTVGYVNASWTLRVDVASQYFTRVLNYMDKNKYKVFEPKVDVNSIEVDENPALSSGYIKRAENETAKQGKKSPWRVYQNYIFDLISLKYGNIKDKYLTYSK